MNRREFLAAGFKLGAAGLLLPVVEPIRRYWSLDRTMASGGLTTNDDLYKSLESFWRALEPRSTPFLKQIPRGVSQEEWAVYWGFSKALEG